MSETLSIVGQYTGIREKTQGWYSVEVEVPGKNYPYRLDTKSSTLLDVVRETKGGIATFFYKESESTNINPKSGKPYTNRFLESVQMGAVAPAAGTTASGSGSSDAMSKEDWNQKDMRDFRSRAWAQTISAFAHTITAEDDPQLVYAKLKPFQRKIYEDIVRDADPQVAEANKPAEAPNPGYEPAPTQTEIDEPPPHTDDDIPF